MQKLFSIRLLMLAGLTLFMAQPVLAMEGGGDVSGSDEDTSATFPSDESSDDDTGDGRVDARVNDFNDLQIELSGYLSEGNSLSKEQIDKLNDYREDARFENTVTNLLTQNAKLTVALKREKAAQKAEEHVAAQQENEEREKRKAEEERCKKEEEDRQREQEAREEQRRKEDEERKREAEEQERKRQEEQEARKKEIDDQNQVLFNEKESLQALKIALEAQVVQLEIDKARLLEDLRIAQEDTERAVEGAKAATKNEYELQINIIDQARVTLNQQVVELQTLLDTNDAEALRKELDGDGTPEHPGLRAERDNLKELVDGVAADPGHGIVGQEGFYAQVARLTRENQDQLDDIKKPRAATTNALRSYKDAASNHKRKVGTAGGATLLATHYVVLAPQIDKWTMPMRNGKTRTVLRLAGREAWNNAFSQGFNATYATVASVLKYGYGMTAIFGKLLPSGKNNEQSQAQPAQTTKKRKK